MLDGPACKREIVALLKDGVNAEELEKERREMVDMSILIMFRYFVFTLFQ
jgi:hypothetical protein